MEQQRDRFKQIATSMDREKGYLMQRHTQTHPGAKGSSVNDFFKRSATLVATSLAFSPIDKEKAAEKAPVVPTPTTHAIWKVLKAGCLLFSAVAGFSYRLRTMRN